MQVFREFYPVTEDFVKLECVWKSDKFILIERKHEYESENQGEDSGGNVSIEASAVNYDSIELVLGGKNHDVLLFLLFHLHFIFFVHIFILCIVQFQLII